MYAIGSRYWIIRDGEEERLDRLLFHIERGDYFPFLATVVGMLGATAADCGETEQAKFVEDTRRDLLYLYERYDLVPKKQRLAFTKEKMVRFDP